MFDLSAVESSLADTIFAGKVHFAAVTGSTNSDALAAAGNGAPHGSVYLADEQTAGRGRGNHAWHSVSGQGLYVSVLLRPALPREHLSLLPLAAGLAAAAAIHTVTGIPIDLRWPNDLLIGPLKTGGILVESRSSSSSLTQAVIVGIGINVHQRQFDPGLSTPATSLDVAAGRIVSRRQLLVALLKSLQRETSGMADSAAAQAIPARIAQVSSWVSGRRVQVHGPQACTGITAGLDAHGFLLVRTSGGLVQVQTGGIRAAENG